MKDKSAVKQIEISKKLRDVCGRFEGTRGMRVIVSKNLMFLLLMLLMLLQPLVVSASQLKEPTDTAHICLRATQMMESKHNIKKHLLTTIASIESGRWDEKRQQKLAWPWTINAQGKGYFFNTKAEAVKKARELKAQGITSIDVGCMQINMLYHGQEFASLEEAFDPMHNVEYAAKFLNNLYESNDRDWLKAAMAYHSSIPEKANVYRKKIVEAFEIVKSAHKNDNEPILNVRPKVERLQVAELEKIKKLRVSKKTASNRSTVKKSVAQNKLDVKAWREAKLEEYRVQKLLARRY